MTDDIEAKIAAVFTQHVADIRELIDEEFGVTVQVCESPIERLMLARLAVLHPGYGTQNTTHNVMWEYGIDKGPGDGLSFAPFQLSILPQEKLGTYRVDFLVILAIPRPKTGAIVLRKYIVECDGHDFHEKTKQQASRDKARDRYLQALGYPVFRYTGSEIFANAEELLRDLEKAMHRDIEEIGKGE